MSDTVSSSVTAPAPPQQAPSGSSPEDQWLRSWGDSVNGFDGTPQGNLNATYQKLMADPDLKLPPGAALGVVQNLFKESGLQGINERNPVVPGSRGGFGWAQWTGDRRVDFEQFARDNDLDPSSAVANYAFLKHDLLSRPQLLGQLQKTDDGDAAYNLFNYRYEQGRGLERPQAQQVAPSAQSPEDTWLQQFAAQQKAPAAPQQQAAVPPAAPAVPQPPNSQSFTTVARPGVPSAPPAAATPAVPQAAAPTPGAAAPVPQVSAVSPGNARSVPPVAGAPPPAATPPVPPASWGFLPNLANAGLFGLLPSTAAANATVGGDLITGTGAPVDNPTSPAPDAAAIDAARRQWTQQHDRLGILTEVAGTLAGAGPAPAAAGELAAAGAARLGLGRAAAAAARIATEGATAGALDRTSDNPLLERAGIGAVTGLGAGAVAAGVERLFAPALRELQNARATLGDLADKFGIKLDGKLASDLGETAKIVTGTPSGAAGDEVRALYNRTTDALISGKADSSLLDDLNRMALTSKNPETVKLAQQLRENVLDGMERSTPELAGTIHGARAHFDAAMTMAQSGGAVKSPDGLTQLGMELLGAAVGHHFGATELGAILGGGVPYVSPALQKAARLWQSSAAYRSQLEAASQGNSSVARGLAAVAQYVGRAAGAVGSSLANPNTAPPPVAP